MTLDHIDVLRRHLDAENAHDLPATLATVHPDCRFQDHATGQVWHGRLGAEDHYSQWWSAFDVSVAREPGQNACWASAALYIAEATWRGRHRGAFLGVPATGRPIALPFVVVVAFAEQLISGEAFYYDLGSLLRQIGEDRWPELADLPHRAAESVR
jgi:steroid delta-isomerase-like uncharacterized protein